jgi:hypothetical protein
VTDGNATLVVAILAIFLGWVVPSWLVATYAEKKNYSFWGFFILSILIGWIIALLAALILKDRGTQAPTKQCPDCAETILAAARVCKHCGHRVEDSIPA